MWKCKHCNIEFNFDTKSEKANHTRWCHLNPKRSQFIEENKQRAVERNIQRFGLFVDIDVECSTCECTFTITERSKLFDSNKKYYCSKTCSNSVGGAANAARLEANGEFKSYTVICFKHHKRCCILCGFDKIVEVHHYDYNHHNNVPENLVPLCPNHHQMVHSKYRSEIISDVDAYVKKFKDGL